MQECKFIDKLKAEGKKIIHRPLLRAFNLQPDFLCLDTDTYYIVVRNRQTFYSKKTKIGAARKAGYKIEVIKPDGESFLVKERSDKKEVKNKVYKVQLLKEEYDKLERLAGKEGLTIKEYLNKALEVEEAGNVSINL